MPYDYILTGHAAFVIAEREIRIEWVERVFARPERTQPDRSDPDLKHALGRIEEFGGRVLRVVYNDVTTPKRIITAYFDRTLKGEL